MSETDNSSPNFASPEQEPEYTVTLNGTVYEMSQAWRDAIERRAELEYEGNDQFSCWWKIATESDAESSDIHEVGDPILVIETVGVNVPWERLDQLEVEEETNDSFDGIDTGDESEEKSRTHFKVTPQEFEEVPSPEGEDPNRVPAKPREFDDPEMVMWIPDNPDIEHSWGTGEAITSMSNWVEWNVQAKADQPRPVRDKDSSHNHFESLAKTYDSEKVGEVEQVESESETKQGPSGSEKRKGKNWFEGETGSNWDI